MCCDKYGNDRSSVPCRCLHVCPNRVRPQRTSRVGARTTIFIAPAIFRFRADPCPQSRAPVEKMAGD
jgi:hypothetical protein